MDLYCDYFKLWDGVFDFIVWLFVVWLWWWFVWLLVVIGGDYMLFEVVFLLLC